MGKKPSRRESATGLVIYEVLRLHGRLIAAGDALMADLGLTSARWQVLGTVAARDRPLTVSDVARILGQSRQSIQRLANELAAAGLVDLAASPADRRALQVALTAEGRRLHGIVEARRLAWTGEVARAMREADVEGAAAALAALRKVLDRGPATVIASHP